MSIEEFKRLIADEGGTLIMYCPSGSQDQLNMLENQLHFQSERCLLSGRLIRLAADHLAWLKERYGILSELNILVMRRGKIFGQYSGTFSPSDVEHFFMVCGKIASTA